MTIANFRKVKWDSFQPNFFIVFAPGVLDNVAGTYMTSVHFDGGQARSLASLARQFPSVSIFDIQDLLERVRSVFDKAVLAVQSVFFFTLFAGLTVMMAAVQASRDERRYESAMLRTLGASRSTVLQGILAEFTTLGLLSGLLAALGASIARLLRRHARAGVEVRIRRNGVARRHCGRRAARGLQRMARHALGHQSSADHHAPSRIATRLLPPCQRGSPSCRDLHTVH